MHFLYRPLLSTRILLFQKIVKGLKIIPIELQKLLDIIVHGFRQAHSFIDDICQQNFK